MSSLVCLVVWFVRLFCHVCLIACLFDSVGFLVVVLCVCWLRCLSLVCVVLFRFVVFVCLFDCLRVCLLVCLIVCLFGWLLVCVVCVFVCLFVCLFRVIVL